MRGGQAGAARVGTGRIRRHFGEKCLRGQGRLGRRRLGRKGGRDQEQLRLRIVEADGDAVGRCLGVEGQPGRSRHRDPDLADQQVGSPRHPESDDVAGADSAMREAAGDGARASLDLGIGEGGMTAGRVPARAVDDGGMVWAQAGAVGKDFSQNLVPDEVRAALPA